MPPKQGHSSIWSALKATCNSYWGGPFKKMVSIITKSCGTDTVLQRYLQILPQLYFSQESKHNLHDELDIRMLFYLIL